jgi:serine/threonine-protein kinase
VKPDNILLDGASGRALLLDFGIAHVTRDGRPVPATSGGSVFGTVQFMSPEQARGEPVDGRSDLYSLGVVGYYALAGHLPFSADSDSAVVALHCTTPPPPIVSPGVPRRLVQAVERCLAKLPADRFQDGAALGRALAAALPGGAPPPIAVRAFLTRSAHLAGLALMYEAFVGLLVAPAVLWWWLYGGARWLDFAAAGGAVAAVLLPLGVAWARARRLLTDGHGWEDLTDALVAERERHREELSFIYGTGPSRFERGLQWLSRFSLGVATLGTVLLLQRPDVAAQPMALSGVAGAAALALLAAVVARARTQRRTDPRGERRLRFWSGALGRWVFRLAVAGLRRGAGAASELQSLETPA